MGFSYRIRANVYDPGYVPQVECTSSKLASASRWKISDMQRGDNENFFTHFKKTSDNSKILFLAFENGDGIGSSRILLKTELSKIFSNGYYVALPDRNFGLAIAKDISETELKKTKILVKKMYKVATSPMSPNLHEPIDFDLPPEWLTPIDENYSQLLINEAINLS